MTIMEEYALGRSDGETRRLILQHQIYGPLTRRLLADAGITAGMRVLDVGSGAGDVALAVAERVGPRGRVVGIDANPAILAIARDRADAAGWGGTVEFRTGDITEAAAGETFDAVVGRWVLMYQPDPVAVVRRLADLVRPNGVVAFQESDLRTGARSIPSTPLFEQVLRWGTPPPGAPGPELEMGPKLFATFVRAGLPGPQLWMAAPAGGGPDWPGYRYAAETLRSLLPFLERSGVVGAAEVDIDTLADRLRDEAVAMEAVQVLPPVFGAWTRV
jgi:SAM-dependent methyltransferase